MLQPVGILECRCGDAQFDARRHNTAANEGADAVRGYTAVEQVETSRTMKSSMGHAATWSHPAHGV